ncbi:HRDC domain-containing protein [Paenibacillus tarimensis]|uniref:HRDC domain-containing protein n=1 Tax=Paenibacillus tarimensis TaxID=416012 RepID=UPI001F1C9EA7|nr:HRDC domain-containing protein [Paenibacillus tarimensis]MCF2942951.1 HRDC domain-containing protein [Paenibacillus tarimensis]
MRVVFLNTLEKQQEDGRIVTAQVTIGEEHGRWSVEWRDEASGETSVWYEGTSWEEMLAAFRHGAAVKMGDGYEPMLDGILEDRKAASGGIAGMLQCYAEQHVREEVFEELREWRRGRAAEEKKAAYVVANNRMLRMIAAFIPHTEEELKNIPGWGEARSATYGSAVLDITTRYERSTVFPLDWVAGQLDPEAYTKWLYRQKEDKYRLEMERHQVNRLILSGIQDGSSLDELQEVSGMQRRDLIIRIEELDEAGYDTTPLLRQELDRYPQDEQEKIIQALNQVGDMYLKPVLQHVYKEDELQGKPLEPLYEKLRLMRLYYRHSTGAQAG